MSVCPTVSVLRFYGCCHPCSNKKGFGVQQGTLKEMTKIYANIKYEGLNREYF